MGSHYQQQQQQPIFAGNNQQNQNGVQNVQKFVQSVNPNFSRIFVGVGNWFACFN
jgi:hypothetical protein